MKKPKIKYSLLKILTGSDLSRRQLPLMVVESSLKDPVVWLTACGHGDEVGGIVVVQEIFKMIRKRGLLRGSLYAFPLMNPIGFETNARSITLTREDLNRSFPGNSSGSLGERVANKIFTSIIETKPTLVLDLHNDWIKSIPYTLLDPYPGPVHKEAYEKTKIFGEKTGLLIIREKEELNRSLSYSIIKKDIPALTLELGESYVVNEMNIECGVKSIWNILAYLKMTEPLEKFFNYPLPKGYQGKILDYLDKPLSPTSGIIRFLVKPGTFVKKNQPIAKIYNVFGKLQETMLAFSNSIVLGHSDSSVAFPGTSVMAFGITPN
ncbi:MAG: hypothetical protein COT24_01265 [Candidatus Kerfeldbacteria bacterium CG08_land_8_20_14_0_20_40_16]|uniref:Succinylglutamate desuccinylase/Aspartoacylase catalytic domain-containing protein n=1 Tax=Candidatus Kerfeldbacteria bacterium CG08_land_8_20_14_0_20_40_16 TaxID=2014244 RepID=A0A2H0YWL8_9BACT|nr:MAG: hypothetical protein COT24_01265 [Candidatus Kerfeldbacteria bacterium CG08_land_8_20_14_0_20_40_16]